MPALRVLFLWHMHQPYYKDLVSGEYRLPWVRLHGLKDYYGMVKLLEEFPQVHQTFNLVPSLMAQLDDYVAGRARDPFLDVAAQPAADLSPEQRRFALQYLFQANPGNMIGRYPRYRELWERFRGAGESPEKAEKFFQKQDYTDLQVLSQLAWFDEFFLEEPEIAALVKKGHGYSPDEQRWVMEKQRELLGRVLPEYKAAAERGSIEISTSPYYHPILPLVCDTDQGRVSSPGLPLPEQRFRHPEDAEEQLRRGLDLHERVFGRRPRGAWPSEGSVSEEALAIAHKVGLEWMATDEGVLGRSLGVSLHRDRSGKLEAGALERLYTIYRYEKQEATLHMVFRDHALSDLIGFVYAGMAAKEAAAHLIQSIKESAQPVLRSGKDAVVSIILDGENAWEFYPRSGREFLRRLYDGLGRDPQIEVLTIAEAIARQKDFGKLSSLVPGSWINANFNVWIGAREDNHAWDRLAEARDFYAGAAPKATEEARQLAFEELMIAEGSDWNWWYGPEHHSANDREFDELYRKHLSNVYQALGSAAPDALAQPIFTEAARPYFVSQTAFIHPRIDGATTGYFDWVGAAMYTADRRSSAMHGKQFVLDAVYAGIDESNLYGRLDFAGEVPGGRLEVVIHMEGAKAGAGEPRDLRLDVTLDNRAVAGWKLGRGEDGAQPVGEEAAAAVLVRLRRVLEFQMPLNQIPAPSQGRVRLRFSLWREHLPIDALPLEGWIELDVLSDEELATRQ